MRTIPILSADFSFDFRDSTRVFWTQGSAHNEEESCIHSMQYYVNDETIAQRFGHCLEPLQADWIDVALSCYLADRIAQRLPCRNSREGRSWSRKMNLTIPVRQLESWTKQAVVELSSLLGFLT